MASAHFDPDLLRFLSDLKRHNERAWFEKNKPRYERSVRDPVLRFLSDLAPKLGKISPRFVVDPRPVGGSMMRIHRDIRFSKDKSPYKTGIGAHFRHEDGEDGGAPAFYLRLEPGASAVGGGIWRPEPAPLQKIRSAIASRGDRWRKITTGRDFKSTCGMEGESLKRPPAGFPADHPLIEDLKRKDFGVAVPLTDRAVTSSGLLDEVLAAYRACAPFIAFLTEAVGLRF